MEYASDAKQELILLPLFFPWRVGTRQLLGISSCESFKSRNLGLLRDATGAPVASSRAAPAVSQEGKAVCRLIGLCACVIKKMFVVRLFLRCS